MAKKVPKVEQVPTVERVKETIICELETSNEVVFPGTFVIKYGIPWKKVETAIDQLRRKRMIL